MIHYYTYDVCRGVQLLQRRLNFTLGTHTNFTGIMC